MAEIATDSLSHADSQVIEQADRPDAPRHYVVGLPVAVTVHADGRVTLDVDLAEIGDIDEDDDAWARYGSATVSSDTETAQQAAARLGNCLTLTINPTA